MYRYWSSRVTRNVVGQEMCDELLYSQTVTDVIVLAFGLKCHLFVEMIRKHQLNMLCN